jgi:cyclic nucleotide-binding protein/FHA domain-containing protein
MEKPLEAVNLNDIASFLVTGKSGDEIFHAGDPGAEMYVVRKGQIELSRPAPGGRTQTVVRVQAGEFFGEESLFEPRSRPASARAVSDYQLIRLDATVFDRIINEDPGIAVQMIRSLLHRAWLAADIDAKAARSLDGAAGQPRIGESLSPGALPREPILVHPGTGRAFPIEGDGELTVGRVSGTSAVKPAIDLSELDADRTLSRRHAHLIRRGDEVYLRAVKEARNGTFVNGRRVDATEVRLNEGDRISFGLVETVFRHR